MEIFRCFYFNILLLATFSIFFLAVSATDPYSEALLSLKSELVDEEDSLRDWVVVTSGGNSTGKSNAYCSWSGIKCGNNSKTVTLIDLSMKKLGGAMSGKQFSVFTELEYLNLSHNFFSGQLPVEIFNLTILRSLDISRNNFSGHFPGGISRLKNLLVLDAFSNSFSGPLPAELSELENLKVLNLAGSYFKGPIPSEYGSFRSLEFLHLAGNLLSGNLPPELGNLKTVTHMEIGYNSYQGFIPFELGNMSELRYLDIAGANLSGPIPKQLSNLTNLKSLYLFRNQLVGTIPSEFSKIKSLTDLDLSDNLISGPIPESFSKLESLSLLSLMYNDMNGTVPEGIAQLPNLETLLIWSNDFSGLLPQSLGKNSNLMWVDVSTNNFVGSIPPDICNRGVLHKLILFSNRFSGSLSPSLSNCSSLVRLRLEDNLFTGHIPLKFRHLPDISYVDISRNKFLGGIPSDISQAIKLTYFNVSNNPLLGGTIPAQTWSLPLLQNFSASSCRISGNLPQFESCKSVSSIELDRNNLSGVIPFTVSNCQNLESIKLSSNNLSGPIPEQLASIPVLGVVDLSHNNLNGPIPAKFSASSSLQLLNVSFNYISGSIPKGNLFRFMDNSAFVGNPELCGAPLQPCSGSVGILGSKGTWKLTSIVLLCAGLLIFLVAALSFGIVYFRRGVKSQWKMISFIGLPQFTANDVLTSFNTTESREGVAKTPSPSVSKAVLPTGITVLVKRIEWEKSNIKVVSEFIMQLGNARHKNLIRLLGFCYNQNLAYILYDYLPNGNLAEKIGMKRDWAAKFRIVIGIAKGLCFLHHDCYPAMPHGDLKSSNVVFDENMEPHLAEFGLKHVLKLSKGSSLATTSSWEPEYNEAMKDEFYADVYKFGEMILEILTNGRLTNAAASIHGKPKDVLLGEIYDENEVGSATSPQEIKLVLEVALLCTRSKPSDRPSMEEALTLLSGSKPPEDRKY
ncbi:leucine-rich repeat receptor-like protein kinase TDR isoform X2 [Prosopis cineraria]|uniref:leucine-rich repeat receptor-like protein kinase TDR isoform X2 n=1 Tax=Prosopis cineraria TaxID=364024 RepID=UPI00240FE879|nr:leucine-rich repeat receptor-like protein kinase TDR isoform X2 [Prosopis cineraria]